MAWPQNPRLAKSLVTLRDQINKAYPNRSKATDGALGDARHAAKKSDHNPRPGPDGVGIVLALDITHDPANGCDVGKLAESLRSSRDTRVNYFIFNKRICSSSVSPWTWRSNSDHTAHIHISVQQNPALYDDPRSWTIGPIPAIPTGTVTTAKPTTDAIRHRMARTIIDYESIRDKNGHLIVHKPPDGSYEIAGINSVSHPKDAANIKALMAAGKHDEVDRQVENFVLNFTQPAEDWSPDLGCEFYLRDCIHNRGREGAARILQMALTVPVDGEVGPITRAAINQYKPDVLLTALRLAREAYEIQKYGKREQYWRGLNNRWDKALADARKFAAEGQIVATTTAGGVVVGGGVAGTTAAAQGFDWTVVVLIVLIAIGLGIGAYFLLGKRRKEVSI